MPVNSFEHYPLSWIPDVPKLTRPFYLSLAKQLMYAIEDNQLAANTQLPPQRELADYLDVNLSTVTKAYRHCRVNGYVYGIVGKGTFVSPNRTTPDPLFQQPHIAAAKLGLVEPFYQFDHHALQAAAEVFAQETALSLFRYDHPFGTPKQQQAACQWLKKLGISVKREQLCLLPGVQNALTVTLMALFQPGDCIAVDTFTYSNFIKLANLLNIRLVPIDNDAAGMLPAALEKACRTQVIRGVFLMPTCSNPTTTTMSASRRQALCNSIQQQQLIVIEDETFAFLNEEVLPSFFQLLPQQTVHIHGVSKALSAGLRTAFLAAGEPYYTAITQAALAINLTGNAISAEIVTQLIENQTAQQLVKKKRKKAAEYTAVFQHYFSLPTVNTSFFQWLPLPVGITSREFEAYARERHMQVIGSHHFSVEQAPQDYLRIALSSTATVSDLRRHLETLSTLLTTYVKSD